MPTTSVITTTCAANATAVDFGERSRSGRSMFPLMRSNTQPPFRSPVAVRDRAEKRLYMKRRAIYLLRSKNVGRSAGSRGGRRKISRSKKIISSSAIQTSFFDASKGAVRSLPQESVLGQPRQELAARRLVPFPQTLCLQVRQGKVRPFAGL